MFIMIAQVFIIPSHHQPNKTGYGFRYSVHVSSRSGVNNTIEQYVETSNRLQTCSKVGNILRDWSKDLHILHGGDYVWTRWKGVLQLMSNPSNVWFLDNLVQIKLGLNPVRHQPDCFAFRPTDIMYFV